MKRLTHKILSGFNFKVPRRFDHKTIFIPVLAGVKVGISGEPWMLEILKILFQQRDGVFIDVGVNLGQTMIKVKSAEPERKYIGFEPNPVCVAYANKLIETNKFQHCTIIPTGLFTESKILQLNLYQTNDHDSSASMIEELRPVDDIKQTIYVSVSDFEPIAKLLAIDKIGFIKVDVEGAELEVFLSLHKAIETHRPLILVEILPEPKGAEPKGEEPKPKVTFQQLRQEKIEALFLKMGYQIYRINKTSASRLTGLEKVSLSRLKQSSHLRDYLLVPSEQVKTIDALFQTQVQAPTA